MATDTSGQHHADAGHVEGGHAHAGDAHGGHASVKFYWMIGAILAILTAMEVAAFYMELGSFEAPFMLILSAAKFALVVMFFMHLKFDSKILTGLFVAGLLLATLMISGMIILYHVLPAFHPMPAAIHG